ncbi:hypothetical protein D3C81_639000 [compost metagenome]
MGLFAGRQLLLEGETLGLFGPLRGGGGIAECVQVGLVQPVLLGQLLTVAPVLHFPDTTSSSQHQQQNACQCDFQCPGTHGTSLKKTWWPSFNVSLAPFTQPGGLGMVVA